MNLQLLMRIYAGLMGVMLLGGLFAPEAMMEGFGMNYTKEVKPILHFALMSQGLFALLTYFISSWMADDLQKVAPAFAALSLAPVLMNTYHVVSGVVPLVGAFYVENGIWVAFAAMFFVYSKK